MPRSEALNNAIEAQMARVNKDDDGNLLCRKCSSIVPPEFKFMVHHPEDESVVWGPYCSEDCIVYAKICTSCSKDFDVEDQDQIRYFGDGKWICNECSKDLVYCSHCNKITDERGLTEIGGGSKICNTCLDSNYFKDEVDGEYYNKQKSARHYSSSLTIAQYPSVNFDRVHRSNLDKALAGLTPTQVGACKRCDGIRSKSELQDGYCENCYSRTYVCDSCKEREHRGTGIGGGKKVCNTCIKKYVRCDICYRYELKDSTSQKKVNGFKSATVCSRCSQIGLKECTFCLKLKPKDEMRTYTRNGGEKVEICQSCQDYSSFCDECQDFHFQEGQCRSDMDRRMSYSYTPEPLVFNHADVKQDRLFFGFENEMNYNSENKYRKAMKDVYSGYRASELYLKSDSSIHGYGFECVSHPMNLSYFRKLSLAPLFQQIPKKDDTSCGLHVHVSRTSFISDVHIFKVVRFVNDGDSFIKLIAGRDYNGYAHKIGNKLSSHVKNKHGDKYNAVNLSPSETIEIRIFRGAKTEYQLRYRIEFVHALVTYTRTSSLSEKDEKNFVAWVYQKKNQYPSLHRFLKAEYKG